MSEPVGNAPRRDIPGNTHKGRELEAKPPAEEKLEAVVTGKIIRKKQPFVRRVGRAMFAEDVQNVGEFIATDVLAPAIRNLVYDIVSQGMYRVLYGTSKVRRPGMSAGAGPVTSLKTAYNKASEGPARDVERASRARHDFDMIILETRTEALEVLDRLYARVEHYGRASVSDLYDTLGVTSAFTDQNWGWKDLRNSGVRQHRNGFVLDLPQPIDLR